MSKRNSAPTVGWVFGSQLYKWLALALIVSLLFWGVIGWTIAYIVRRDCHNYYKRDLKLLSYWVHIEVGRDKLDCPAPYDS